MRHIKLFGLVLAMGLWSMAYSVDASAQVTSKYYDHPCTKAMYGGAVWHTCTLPGLYGLDTDNNWVIVGAQFAEHGKDELASCRLLLGDVFGWQDISPAPIGRDYGGWIPMDGKINWSTQRVAASNMTIYYNWPLYKYLFYTMTFECREQAPSVSQSKLNVVGIITGRVP